MMIKRLEFLTESLNAFTGAHWTKWSDYCERCHAHVFGALGVNLKRAKDLTYVNIISHRTRLLDYDNFVGGAKPIVDSIVRLGWVRDDKPGAIRVIYDQVQDRGGYTEIMIDTIPSEVWDETAKEPVVRGEEGDGVGPAKRKGRGGNVPPRAIPRRTRIRRVRTSRRGASKKA